MPEEININNEIEIEETPTETQAEEFDFDGLEETVGHDEFELIKSHGLVPEKKAKEEKVVEKVKVEVVKPDEETPAEEINKDPDNFDDMEKVFDKDEKKFHETYTPNQKALYFKSKANIKKRQDAIKELQETKTRLEEAIKGSSGQKKLDKIADLLANKPNDLTIEMLESIIAEKEEAAAVQKAHDVEAQKKVVIDKIQQKNMYAEQIGMAQHKNFIHIAQLANELYQSDRPNGAYRAAIDSAYSDEVDEAGLVNTIVQVAKFHPKFKEISESVDSVEKDKVDRAVTNSKKKISSASVGTTGSRRVISYDDLTVEQLVNLPSDKYKQVPIAVRDKLLRGIKGD